MSILICYRIVILLTNMTAKFGKAMKFWKEMSFSKEKHETEKEQIWLSI